VHCHQCNYLAEELVKARDEIESLRAQVVELADAFAVIWVSDDRAAWDGKAVEHFDALLAKVGGSDTATPDAQVTDSPASSASPSGLPGYALEE
jgi:hypothetical protein